MTVIEIRPHRRGWKAFEAPGVEPVFSTKDDAINYGQSRARFRTGEIGVLDSIGAVEHVIAFNEADRKLRGHSTSRDVADRVNRIWKKCKRTKRAWADDRGEKPRLAITV
jgi:hypothetical protein